MYKILQKEAENKWDSILTPAFKFFLCFKVTAAAGKL